MKLIIKYGGLILSVMALVSGCTSAKGMDMPQMEKTAVSVETTVLTKGIIGDTRSYSGTVEYSESYTVSPEISGKVEMVNYKVGDEVKTGDILFTISDKDIQNNIAQLEASASSASASIQSSQTALEQVEGSSKSNQLTSIESNITLAKVNIENAKSSLASAETAVNQAETKMNTANTTYKNNKMLFEAGAVSQLTFEDSERDYNNTVDSYEEAKRSYENCKISLSKAEEDLVNAEKSYDIYVNKTLPENKQTAQNNLNTAQASASSFSVQLEQARNDLENTSVKSPISGTISVKNIEPGSFVTTSTSVFTIINTDTVTVKVNVTEQIITGLKLGDKVVVTISSLDDGSFEGTVSSISPITDSSGTYPVEVDIDNSSNNLVIGMHAKVSFMKDISEDAYVVPVDAVLSDENDKYVFIVEGGKAKRVNVTTDIENATEIQLTSGVSENDEVITKGQSSVNDGEDVNVVNTSILSVEKRSE